MCPKCESNNVTGVIIDGDKDPQDGMPIVHFVCESCGTEWVE